MTPKKPDWFELTEGGDSYSGIQRINKKLPLMTLLIAGAVILGGSLFATANNEPAAVAETPAAQTVAQEPAAAKTVAQEPAAAKTVAQEPAAAKTVAQEPAPSQSVAQTSPSASTSQRKSLPLPKVTSAPKSGENEGREGHERGENEGRDDD